MEAQSGRMRKRQIVRLTPDERAHLLRLISAGKAPARKLAHARILLQADHGPDGPGCTDAVIAEALDVGEVTVWRVRKRYVEEGLEAALTHRHPKNHRPCRLDGDQEARLIALACSEPPAGHPRWTLRLLAGRMVELQYAASVSHETVRVTLKKTTSNRG
jgi:transposase